MIGLAVVLGGWFAGTGVASAQSHFLSYASEGECVAAHVLDAASCRGAFVNARAEFEAKTQAFASVTQCVKTYGDCAAWLEPGQKGGFRPRWPGVDIVDTPREKTATPSPLSGPKRVSFAPQPLTEFRKLDVRVRPALDPSHAVPQRLASHPLFGRSRPESVEPPSAPPPPGSGFKLEDGVLTFPAPARFQPKNLPRQP